MDGRNGWDGKKERMGWIKGKDGMDRMKGWDKGEGWDG